ncbi:hypothetical protein DH2020_028587 [Rehmannia glutinosa]|uniref:Uncharacterized protein n=1 Tax=Rehmannia glutinosa TaxID=99300 RepID=A0ABR0VQY2_REHGL
MASMFLFSIILTFIFHQALANSNLETYIVHLSLPEDRIFEQSESLESWYHSYLPDRDPSRIVHTYRHVINGFAAKLTPRELEEIEKKDGFLYARPEKKYSLHTTRTPTFLGLNQNNGPWTSPASFGKGVIIGVLDTGITPSHPSFDDKGVPPPPAKWKGKCEFNKETCNNKLIGARSFVDNEPPFDQEGHGTHTAKDCGRNFVPVPMLLSKPMARIRISPLAHLAIYRVCKGKNCFNSAILAGIDEAIEDGVDVISMSIGYYTSLPFYKDSIAIGSFAAMKKGILVDANDKSYFRGKIVLWLMTNETDPYTNRRSGATSRCCRPDFDERREFRLHHFNLSKDATSNTLCE